MRLHPKDQTSILYRLCYFASYKETCNTSTLTSPGFFPLQQCHTDVPSTISSRPFPFESCASDEQQPGSSTCPPRMPHIQCHVCAREDPVVHSLPLTSHPPKCHPPHPEGLHLHKPAAWKRWQRVPNVLATPLIRAAEHFWHWVFAFRPMARCVEWELPLHVAFSDHLSLWW
jgi:hypothetical protein